MFKKIYVLTAIILAPLALYATKITEGDLKEDRYYFFQYGKDQSDYTKKENFVALMEEALGDSSYFPETKDFEKHVERFFLDKEVSPLQKHTFAYEYEKKEDTGEIALYHKHIEDFLNEETIKKEHILKYIKEKRIENVCVLEKPLPLGRLPKMSDLQWKRLKVVFPPKQEKKPDEETSDSSKKDNSGKINWVLLGGISASFLLICIGSGAYWFMKKSSKSKVTKGNATPEPDKQDQDRLVHIP
ncbi:MAG: hypothetical protein AAF335_02305 [Bacteroidota bacterium]